MQTDGELIRQARGLFDKGDFAGAEQAYRELAEQLSEDKRVDVTLVIGACQQAQGHDDEALETFQQAVARDDSRAESWFQLGRARRRAGDETGATEALEKAVVLDPNHALARVELGHQALAAGERESAQAHYRTALRAQPDCVPAMVGLAERLLDTGEVDQAYELSTRAVRLRPGSIETQLAAARVFMRRGHPDFAERCLENALSAAPNSAELHRAKAQLLLQRGRAEEGLAAAAEARRCGASDHQVGLLEIRGLHQLGDLSEARRRLEAFSRHQPLDAAGLLMLAELRLSDGDAQGARELVEQLEGDWPEAGQLVRARLAEMAGERARAAELAAALHDDGSARIRRQSRLLSARLAMADDQPQPCIEALQPLAAEGDEDPFVHWMLAKALDQAGRHEEAAAHLPRTGWRVPPLLQVAAAQMPNRLYDALENFKPDGWPSRAPDDGRAQPVFILGWPGSGRDQLLAALAEQWSTRMLDREGAAQRREILGLPAWPENLAALDEGRVRLARKRYLRQVAGEEGQVLEPMWLPLAALPAIARLFPNATVVLADADTRDLELDWRLAGYRGINDLRTLCEREQAVLETLLERLPLDFMVFSRGDLERDSSEVAAELARVMGLEDASALAEAIDRQFRALPATGHWRHYGELFGQSPAE
ncbi:MAG: tetratricopeptide repeat protein [Xanthomonadales bacterium]|nr:tetratricopeptide repeat protein [Xanthomonadales bacterium]